LTVPDAKMIAAGRAEHGLVVVGVFLQQVRNRQSHRIADQVVRRIAGEDPDEHLPTLPAVLGIDTVRRQSRRVWCGF
jgi:hypothetical protein